MNKFQSGAFKLAIKEKKPILPISIKGTIEAIPKGSWIFKTRVSATLKVLPAIDVESFKAADYARLSDMVWEEIIPVADLISWYRCRLRWINEQREPAF